MFKGIAARKTIFSFSRRPEKIALPKKIALEYDISCIIGKDDISFFRKYDLTPWTVNERWSFFKKNTQKYDIFFRISEKMVFLKRTALAALGLDLAFIIWKDGIFFPWAEQEVWPFSRNTWKYDTCTSVTNVEPHPSVKTNQRWSYPTKIHLKVIDVLYWHPRKSSSSSLYFHGDLYRHFHVLLSSEKNPGNLIHRTEVWLLLQFIRLEIFCKE